MLHRVLSILVIDELARRNIATAVLHFLMLTIFRWHRDRMMLLFCLPAMSSRSNKGTGVAPLSIQYPPMFVVHLRVSCLDSSKSFDKVDSFIFLCFFVKKKILFFYFFLFSLLFFKDIVKILIIKILIIKILTQDSYSRFLFTLFQVLKGRVKKRGTK